MNLNCYVRNLVRPFVPFLLLAFLGCASPADAPVGERVDAVVYGTDDRQEVFEHPDATLRGLAVQSSLAVIRRVELADNGDDTFSPVAPTLGQRQNLCVGERFADQSTAGFCSGVLIDNDLALTAGHCVPSQAACDALLFVFDYRYESAGVLATIDAQDVYTCSRIVARSTAIAGSASPDYAVVQLDRAVAPERVPASLRGFDAPLAVNDSLAMIGHGTGLPAKIDSGAQVADPRLAQADFFIANVDAFAGHSGGPVFDDRGLLLGILVAGREPDYTTPAGDSCTIVNVFADAEADEAVQYIDPVVAAVCDTGWTSALCETTPCTGDDCPPAEWTCAERWYNDGVSCDCNCGALDPDCGDLALPVDGCSPAEMCDDTGACKRIFDEASDLVGTCAAARGSFNAAVTQDSTGRLAGTWGLLCVAFVFWRRRSRVSC